MKTNSFFSLVMLLSTLVFFSCEKEGDTPNLIGEWTITQMATEIRFVSDDNGPGSVVDLDSQQGNFGTVQFDEDQTGQLTFIPDYLNELSQENEPFETTFTWSENNGSVILQTPDHGSFVWNYLDREPKSYRIVWFLYNFTENNVESIEYQFTMTKNE